MNPLFSLLDELRDSQAMRQESLEQRLGVVFAERSMESTEYFRVLSASQSTALRAIKGAELRVPVAKSATSGPLLVLDVDPSAQCIALDEIQKHYGRGPELNVPTPRQPSSAPLDYAYRFAWGRMSFGVSRTPPECLTRVVIDFSKPNT